MAFGLPRDHRVNLYELDEVRMSSQNYGLSTKSLAELALVVSRVSRSMQNESAVPSAPSLQLFWQSGRALQRRWQSVLNDWTADGTNSLEPLERLAPRLFTCEMLVRTWSTVLASLDRQRESDDLTQIARNVVGGLTQLRLGLLSRLLCAPENEQHKVAGIDRLRRRCDRWTDLLAGPIAVDCGCFEFTFDQERARDFGEEGLIADPATGPHPIEHLVSAGLRLTFLQHLSASPVDEPEFVELSQSILSSIPHRSFHRDGSLRSLLEQRIAISQERQAKFGLGSIQKEVG